MGYYKKRKYRKQYNIDSDLLLGFLFLIIFFGNLVVSFINKNKMYIILGSILLFVLIILFLYLKNRKKIKQNIIYKKLKKSEVYQKIIELNDKYKLEPLGIFYDNYKVNKKILLKTINIDEYLMMTIENKYDQLVNYKKKYDALKQEYEQYNKEYNKLYKFIDKEEARKLKINTKNYLKYMPIIYNDNRINVEKEFKIVIYINYCSQKGKVKNKVYKKYNSDAFMKIYREYLKIRQSQEIYKLSSKIERSVMTESMRYDVFKRDGFKCQICGATSKDGAQLHVDHIIPVSKGGKTEMSNLQTLCSRCNLGKSNKL